MRFLRFAIAPMLVVPFAVGCASTAISPERTLTVRWQRLVDEGGNTCARCGVTQGEVRLAAGKLKRALQPLNVRVAFEEVPMDAETVAEDTSQSNRIFINDRPLADWLGGKVGMSLCGTSCAQLGQNVECRTLTVRGRTYEAIPAVLIVRAGLLAAEASLAEQPVREPCCPEQPARACCPG